MFDQIDSDPPFAPEHLDEVLRSVKSQVKRRRFITVVPSAVVIGASYFLFASFAGPAPTLTATTADLTESASAPVIENDGTADLDGPVDGAVVSAPGSEIPVSGVTGAISLRLDPTKVTVLTESETAADVTSELSTIMPPDESSPGADIVDVEPTSELTAVTAPSDATDTSLQPVATDSASPSGANEPSDAELADLPEGASALGGDGAVPTEAPADAPADAGSDPASAVADDALVAAADAATVDTPDLAADLTEDEVDPTSTDPVDAAPDSTVSDAGLNVEDPLTTADPSAPPDSATLAPEVGDPAPAAADVVVPVPIVAVEESVANAPIVVEFAAMTIDGFTVEVVLSVSDADGYSINACGTTMNWGDGSSTGSLCRNLCMVTAPDGLPGSGASGEIRFSHTYLQPVADVTVAPTFTVYTGYECFGDAFFGILNPALLLGANGISVPQ